jgi:hypothetical protein
MRTTPTEYRPSINILRDADVALSYIVTPNAQTCFDRLTKLKGTGQKSFTMVGAYGTGKSAFLWAFRQQLMGTTKIFKPKPYDRKFKFVNIVGDFGSVREVIGSEFGLTEKQSQSSSKVAAAVNAEIQKLEQFNTSLVLVIDEFGKFLEYAVKHDPDGELYFLQLLAETFNDPEKHALLITSLHQDFKAYSFGLSIAQRNEWEKVRGRFVELPFNESVEELLKLASERMGEQEQPAGLLKKNHRLVADIRKSKVYPLSDNLSETQIQNLLPLDLLAASVLTLGLQKFGQNQRSLFSFLDSNDTLGLAEFENQGGNKFYHLGLVFDYLEYNFQTLLHSKYNPEGTRWSGIKVALEKVESLMEENAADAANLVKVIGLLSIFSKDGAKIDSAFLADYGKLAMGIDKPDQLLATMERRKVIRFVRHNSRFVPFDGTDLDISEEIEKAKSIVPDVSEPLIELQRHFDFPYIFAKEAFFSTGTPRIFAYQLSDHPVSLEVEDQIDGHINLIFSNTLPDKEIQAFSKADQRPTLFGWYRNASYISALLTEILRIEHVIATNLDDRVAVKELREVKEANVRLLNQEVLGGLYGSEDRVVWYFNGKQRQFKDSQDLNQCLSEIVRICYPDTPDLENELINRSKISSAINTARGKYLSHLLNYWDQANLGFDDDRFPPEKTIYLSLLRTVEIHQQIDDAWGLGMPSAPSWKPLWEAGVQFLESAKHSRHNLADLVRIYKSAPIKLKQGVVEFWLPTFLFIHRDSFALFVEGKYVPNLTEEILALIQKDASKYEIKTFDTAGIRFELFNRYRQFLQLEDDKAINNQSLVETIKPFLVFFKQLTPYAQRTKAGISKGAIAIRAAIADSTDPERTFFEDFPRLLGFDLDKMQQDERLVTGYIDKLKDVIRELRAAYMGLCDRFEEFIGENILGGVKGFEAMQVELRERIKAVNIRLLPLELKVLVERIRIPFDDRDSWLVAIAQAVLNTRLDAISDDQEEMLHHRLLESVRDIDAFVDVSKVSSTQNAIAFSLTSSSEGQRKGVTVTSERDRASVESLKKNIKSQLSGASAFLIAAALVALLEEYSSKPKR